MRDDMNKVLTERPRRGWYTKTSRGNKPRVQEYVDEDSYSRELRPRRVKSKWFDDHLGPLRRWLRSQVNRPWDKVWSELVAGIDSRTVTGRHLLDHARWEVDTQCFFDDDGALRTREHRWRGDEVEGLYVHPRTRLLRWMERRPRDRVRHHAHPVSESGLVVRALGEDRYHVQHRGIWYEARAEIVERGKKVPVDFKTGWQECHIVWKRQLNHRELREHGLVNESA